jgi:hypothetical protein
MTATKQQQARDAARKARDMANRLERAAGVRTAADRMADKRANERDLQPPPIADRDRRTELETDDAAWLKFYLPKVFKFPFTRSQKYYIDTFAECLEYGASKCVAAPRGDGKSSIARYLAMKYALTRQVRFPLILNATGDKAKKTLAAIKNHLRARSGPLADDYPLETTIARYIAVAPARAINATVHMHPVTACWSGEFMIMPQFTDAEDVPANLLYDYGVQSDDELSGIIMAVGWKSDQIQGCNVFDIRPDFVMLDDLDNRDSLASEIGTVAEKIEAQIETNVAGLVGLGERLGMLMLCTVPARTSAAYRYSDPEIKPAWSGVRVRRIETWPNDTGKWDHYIDLRQRGQKTVGSDGKPVDKHAREAHRYYQENQPAMDAGAVLSNPYDFDPRSLPDGTPKQLTALQKCYDFIADHGKEAFETEYQNNPPRPTEEEQSVLTTFHIRANCRTGYDVGIVPDNTTAVTCGADVQLNGLHTITIAWSDIGAGSIIDFSFIPFEGVEGRPASACESHVLGGLQSWWSWVLDNPWGQTDDEPGQGWVPDFTLIDSGWKDREWGTQPVYTLARQDGFRRVWPCRGMPNWRPRKAVMTPGKELFPMAQINLARIDGTWIAELDADAHKLKVHHAFMLRTDQPGSLALYNPPRDEVGREKWHRHQNYAGHILSEEWQKQLNGTYAWVPEGSRPGRRRYQKANHYLDATAYAVAAWNILQFRTEQAKRQTKPAPKPEQPDERETDARPWLPQR